MPDQKCTRCFQFSARLSSAHLCAPITEWSDLGDGCLGVRVPDTRARGEVSIVKSLHRLCSHKRAPLRCHGMPWIERWYRSTPVQSNSIDLFIIYLFIENALLCEADFASHTRVRCEPLFFRRTRSLSYVFCDDWVSVPLSMSPTCTSLHNFSAIAPITWKEMMRMERWHVHYMAKPLKSLLSL